VVINSSFTNLNPLLEEEECFTPVEVIHSFSVSTLFYMLMCFFPILLKDRSNRVIIRIKQMTKLNIAR
jgi:hypothetical protein